MVAGDAHVFPTRSPLSHPGGACCFQIILSIGPTRMAQWWAWLMIWWLWVRSPVEANFLYGVFPSLTSEEACEKKKWVALERKVVLVLVWESQERHDWPWLTLAVKVALNPNTSNQPIYRKIWKTRIRTVLTLSQTSPGFYVSAFQVFWKQYGKRKNCSKRAISPFPTVFSNRLENFLPCL